MTIDLTQFYQIFFEEAAEHLASLETLLLGLDLSAPNDEDLNAIFRAAHSIKGGAGTFGFNDMVDVTHVLENLLDKIRNHEIRLTDEMVNVFLEAGDVINSQMAAHRGDGEVDLDDVKAVCEKLAELNAGSGKPAAKSKKKSGSSVQENKDAAYGFFDDTPEAPSASEDPGFGFFDEETPSPVIDEGFGFFTEVGELPGQQDLANLQSGQGSGSVHEAPSSGAQDEAAKELTPSRRASDVTDEPTQKGRRAADKAPAATADTSIRVNVEKVDQLINLVGELVITQAMLAQSASEMDDVMFERMQDGLHQLERNTRDLQEVVMSVRMLPISFVFSRYPRVVRDLASKLSKQVELKTIGEGTELDKGLIEKIADPLTHLVRNSLDHGIENPETRIASGKAPKGTITLQASHQGGNVVIEVSDDGGGLNRGKILSKARERGLPVREDMPDQDVWMLIFEPGFSTADVVTDVSGRGVGMDVVKRNITAMGGRIELNSLEGLGTRTTIRLPLTLAILDGLSVRVGLETYIIPLTNIIESLLLGEGDLRNVSGEGHLIHVRGEYLPLVAMRALFNLPQIQKAGGGSIVVIVESEGRKVALLVDELLGQHQVVIKSLESNFRKLAGISGATIMGDGKVALILDVNALSLAPSQHNRLAA